MERRLTLSLGYTEEDLELGVNLGLGCGNPIENANLKESDIVVDLCSGFRVIIMTQTNSQVNTRALKLLPKFKKMNS